jgi:hypothetical protein
VWAISVPRRLKLRNESERAVQSWLAAASDAVARVCVSVSASRVSNEATREISGERNRDLFRGKPKANVIYGGASGVAFGLPLNAIPFNFGGVSFQLADM